MKPKKKVLVVVAHPDDETIWMGNTLLKNKDRWDTTIISLCRREDKDRAPKFFRVCKSFNAHGFMSDLDDCEDGSYKGISPEDIIRRVQGFAGGKYYDSVFTHGENGEYGHIRHKEVNKAVEKMLEEKKISCKELFFFSYIKKGRFCYMNKNANKFIKGDGLTIKRKKYLITGIYGFEKNSFEERCCRRVESFNVKKLI